MMTVMRMEVEGSMHCTIRDTIFKVQEYSDKRTIPMTNINTFSFNYMKLITIPQKNTYNFTHIAPPYPPSQQRKGKSSLFIKSLHNNLKKNIKLQIHTKEKNDEKQ